MYCRNVDAISMKRTNLMYQRISKKLNVIFWFGLLGCKIELVQVLWWIHLMLTNQCTFVNVQIEFQPLAFSFCHCFFASSITILFIIKVNSIRMFLLYLLRVEIAMGLTGLCKCTNAAWACFTAAFGHCVSSLEQLGIKFGELLKNGRVLVFHSPVWSSWRRRDSICWHSSHVLTSYHIFITIYFNRNIMPQSLFPPQISSLHPTYNKGFVTFHFNPALPVSSH